jgi:poly(3-hydroxybutyrate) depolymerase
MRPTFMLLSAVVVLSIPLSLIGCSAPNDAPGLSPPSSFGGSSSLAGSSPGGSSTAAAGVAGMSSNVSGAGGSGASNGGAGNLAGTGNTVAGTSGLAGTAGADAGGSGNGGGSGSGGGGNVGGGYTGATGKSLGCGKAPPGNDAVGSFALHEIHIKAPLSASYLTGGANYDQSGPYDFQFRPYSVRLPTGYDPGKSYAVIFGGGGCGGNAQNFAGNPGSGYDIDKQREVIFVGLSYVAGCFADGGGGTNDMADTPEVPYVHEVLAEVKANYCVDQSRVFITGHSSGGWEAFTVGCALANELRGIAPVSGGLRNHRPACSGPQSSIMVEGLGDTANPIGPIEPPKGNLDSGGSAPARDEILKRNGCVAPDFQFMYTADNTKEAKAGNAPHAVWDPAFPSCYSYTGCPTEYPVVWCALDGGHEVDKEGTVDYKLAMMKFFNALQSK